MVELDLKVGTEREVEYNNILKMQEKQIVDSQITKEISTAVVDFCKKQIAKEQKV